MGLLAGWLALKAGEGWAQPVRLFLATGLLGGFTTFSAFSLDAVVLWQRGEAGAAAAYVLASVGLVDRRPPRRPLRSCASSPPELPVRSRRCYGAAHETAAAQQGANTAAAGARRRGRGRAPRRQGRAESANAVTTARTGKAHAPARPSPKAVARAAAQETLATGVQTLVVEPDEAGMRVDRFLVARFPQLAFTHIQRIVRKGELRIDGKRAKPNERLEAGEGARAAAQARSAAADSARRRGRRGRARLPPVDHPLRGRGRAGAQQAHGARRAGRLRHQAPRRRAARGVARRRGPEAAPRPPARQGHRRLPRRRQDALRRGGAGEILPLAAGAQDLLGARRRRAAGQAGPRLDLPRQGGGGRAATRACASPATATRAPATR